MHEQVHQAVVKAAGSVYDVLGELGREGVLVHSFLARENASSRLVALVARVERNDAGESFLRLSVRVQLDTQIPASNLSCFRCARDLLGWARYCPGCANDLAGSADMLSDAAARQAAARSVAGDAYELLGEMPRAEGGMPVFFGRHRLTSAVVALRLDRPGTGEHGKYALHVSQQIRALKMPEAGDASDGAELPVRFSGQPDPAKPGSDDSGQTPTGAQASSSRTPGRSFAPTPQPLSAVPGAGATMHVCPTCGAVYETSVLFCPKDGSPLEARTARDDLVGRVIANRYDVVRKLGEGGMGQVYEAEQLWTGRRCALKILNPALMNDPEARGRFVREAKHASRINHPHIADIYEGGEAEDGMIYLAMEFVDGESLSSLIAREGPLPVARSLELARQIAEALTAAHVLHIVHRDLKPDNVIVATALDGSDLAKVVDFGIAKSFKGDDTRQLTQAQFVVGTPKYMSPEQLLGEQIDGRSDIYSAGCILYELLVGEPVFTGPTGETLIRRRLTEPPPSPRDKNPDIPQAVDELVRTALARDPEERFRTAEALRDALAALIPRRTIPVADTRTITPRPRPASTTATAPARVEEEFEGDAEALAGEPSQGLSRSAWIAIGLVAGLSVVGYALFGRDGPPAELDVADVAGPIGSIAWPPELDPTLYDTPVEWRQAVAPPRVLDSPVGTETVTRPTPQPPDPRPTPPPPNPPTVASTATMDSIRTMIANARRMASGTDTLVARVTLDQARDHLNTVQQRFPDDARLSQLLADLRDIDRCRVLNKINVENGTATVRCSSS